MSTRTDNYNLIICDGSDIVNPLTQIFPNFTSLDDILRDIANTGITTATELVTGTVHALTRTDANVSVFRFQATSNFTGGETFTVDGAQVTALDVSGETLKTGAYIVGSMVLCELRDTLLTFYVSGGADADTLEGHPASYFATKSDLDTVDDKADANKTLIDGLTSELSLIGEQLIANVHGLAIYHYYQSHVHVLKFVGTLDKNFVAGATYQTVTLTPAQLNKLAFPTGEVAIEFNFLVNFKIYIYNSTIYIQPMSNMAQGDSVYLETTYLG